MIELTRRILVYVLLGLVIVVGAVPILAAVAVSLVLFFPVAFVVALYAVLRLIVLTVFSGVNDFALSRLGGSPRR